jgi:hypothetical protein
LTDAAAGGYFLFLQEQIKDIIIIRMRGSMDVVDAKLLQRSGVALVGLKERIFIKTYNGGTM